MQEDEQKHRPIVFVLIKVLECLCDRDFIIVHGCLPLRTSERPIEHSVPPSVWILRGSLGEEPIDRPPWAMRRRQKRPKLVPICSQEVQTERAGLLTKRVVRIVDTHIVVWLHIVSQKVVDAKELGEETPWSSMARRVHVRVVHVHKPRLELLGSLVGLRRHDRVCGDVVVAQGVREHHHDMLFILNIRCIFRRR